MGVEYYLVSPEKKEKYCLGRHISCIDGVVPVTYKNGEGEYITHERGLEFMLDVIENNGFDFLEPELHTISNMYTFLYEIYEWCYDKKVYLVSDWSDSIEVWKDYKEVGSIYSFCENNVPAICTIAELIEKLLPSKYLKQDTKSYEEFISKSLKSYVKDKENA